MVIVNRDRKQEVSKENKYKPELRRRSQEIKNPQNKAT